MIYLPFFSRYETLVLVAGGIGISPFVALVRDLLHRHQRAQLNLPQNLHLIWAVQKSHELQLLDSIPASAICPDYKSKLNLQVHAFVTREASPLEQDPEAQPDDDFKRPRILASKKNNTNASAQPMSVVSGAGSNLWISACFLASLLGYIIVYLLINHFLVQPFEPAATADGNSEGVSLWVKGLFSVVSMVLGVVIFGGFVVSMWSFLGRLDRRVSVGDEENAHLLSSSESDGTGCGSESGADRLLHPSNTHFGHRPNLRGM